MLNDNIMIVNNIKNTYNNNNINKHNNNNKSLT